MRKVISTGEYTLFFEEKERDYIDCIAYETGKHMSIKEISESLDVSRICVRNNLVKSIKKIYNRIKKGKDDITPLDIFLSMAISFNISTIDDYRSFFNLFPFEIRMEICESAKNTVCDYRSFFNLFPYEVRRRIYENTRRTI